MDTKITVAHDGRELVEVVFSELGRVLLVTFEFQRSERLWVKANGFGLFLLSCVLEDTKEAVPFSSLAAQAQKDFWWAAFECVDYVLGEEKMSGADQAP